MLAFGRPAAAAEALGSGIAEDRYWAMIGMIDAVVADDYAVGICVAAVAADRDDFPTVGDAAVARSVFVFVAGKTDR